MPAIHYIATLPTSISAALVVPASTRSLLTTENCFYICSTCGASEYTESAYRRHLSVTHYRQELVKTFGSSVKKNQCQYCNFSSKSTLAKALVMIIHLGVKHKEVYKIQSMDK